MLLKTGLKLPNGTILQYTKKQFGPESTVGKLEISDGGTRWFISPNNSGWRIRPNSQHDWDKYELGSEGDYTLAKMHENKNKSALDLLKEYRDVVEGRIHEPAFTLLDRSDLDAFMTKRGFVKVDDPRETESVTYKSEGLNLLVMLDHEDDFWTIEDVAQDEVLSDGTGERNLKQTLVLMIHDVHNLKEGNENIVKGSWIPRHDEGQLTWKDRDGIYLVLPGSNSAYGNNNGGFYSEEQAEEFNKQHLGGKWQVKVNGPVHKNGKFNTCDECDGEGCPVCYFTGKYDVGINSDHYL